MELKDLVGFQIVRLDDESMTVKKNGKEHLLTFAEDYGDCCGYTNVKNSLFFDPNITKRNPVIVNVEYSDEGKECESRIRITFFGAHKKLAEIEAEAGSGSGWNYGANVVVACVSLGLTEEIVRY